MRKNNKPYIITIVVIIVMLIGFTILYLFTDIFKSNREKFDISNEYNLTVKNKIQEYEFVKLLQKILENNKTNTKSDVYITHSEGGEISNPLNKFGGKIEYSRDDNQKYSHLRTELTIDEKTYMDIEFLKDDKETGVKIGKILPQIITINNEDNISNYFDSNKNIYFDVFKQFSEISKIGKDVKNIIDNNISKKDVTKLKNTVITYKNQTIDTTAYCKEIKEQKLKDFYKEILNYLETQTTLLNKSQIEKIHSAGCILNNDQEIQPLKITVYDYKNKCIRKVIEQGIYKIEIENEILEDGINVRIEYSNTVKEDNIKIDLKIFNSENPNILEALLKIDYNDIKNEYNLRAETKNQENSANFKFTINKRENITTKNIAIEGKAEFEKDILNKKIFYYKTKMNLTQMQEDQRNQVLEILKDLLPNEIERQKEKIKNKANSNDENLDEIGMSAVEISKFNAKFEFCTGNRVLGKNVKEMIKDLNNDLKEFELKENKIDESNIKKEIKIFVEKDTSDKLKIEELNKLIIDDKKYKISVIYNTSNNLIQYLKIVEL